MGGFEHRTSLDDDQDNCSRFVSSFKLWDYYNGPAASTIPSKQSSAQLTIFYNGTFNVYDNIFADKAQAIMLIASRGNSSSYPHIKARCKVHIDLPIARKHSLQCFMEKRKDTLIANAKSPYTVAETENTKPQQNPSSSSTISLHTNSPP